tara:strand:- start:133 stop:750 length:618 start_codon:yes stop_codon:yes gene_type:complete
MADPSYIVDGVLEDGEAWVAISHTSLSLPAATVTWASTNDGQTGDFSQYMDLVIIAYTRSDDNSIINYLRMNFNNREGERHSIQWFFGNGSAAYGSYSAGTTTPQAIGVVLGGNAVTNGFSCTVAHLSDINSGKMKSGMTASAGEADSVGEVLLNAINWRVEQPGVGGADRTSAIFEIDLTTGDDDFVAGSMFSLFGILPRMVTA